MKNFAFILMFVLMSFNGWTGGGVDVGNHSPMSYKGSFNLAVFKSEESVVEHVQKILPSIENGTFESVRELIDLGECSPEKVKFDTLEVVTSYQVDEENFKMTKEYSGVVTLELEGCEAPSKLPVFEEDDLEDPELF